MPASRSRLGVEVLHGVDREQTIRAERHSHGGNPLGLDGWLVRNRICPHLEAEVTIADDFFRVAHELVEREGWDTAARVQRDTIVDGNAEQGVHRDPEPWWSLGTVAARIIMVWLYNNTGKSVFGVALDDGARRRDEGLHNRRTARDRSGYRARSRSSWPRSMKPSILRPLLAIILCAA